MRMLNKAIAAITLLALPSIAQAGDKLLLVSRSSQLTSAPLRGTSADGMKRLSRTSSITAATTTVRTLAVTRHMSLARERTTRVGLVKVKWNQLIAKDSIAQQTAAAYISDAIHQRAAYSPWLANNVTVLRSQLTLNPNRTRPNAIEFTVPVKIKGESGVQMVKGFIRTDEAGKISVSDRVSLVQVPNPGPIFIRSRN